ncbi:unnamed protein product, partial [Amoebophrya sp. A120]|eukprot:GSA120T00010759001.1
MPGGFIVQEEMEILRSVDANHQTLDEANLLLHYDMQMIYQRNVSNSTQKDT